MTRIARPRRHDAATDKPTATGNVGKNRQDA
jgi:hypothetical protein